MAININALGGVGFVRSIHSRRVRGQSIPVDLVRAVCKQAARVAIRRRVAAAFSGYLVSDFPLPKTENPFSRHREFHLLGIDPYCCTTTRFPIGLRHRSADAAWIAAGGPLDAPVLLAAGSCDAAQKNTSYVWREGEK